MLEFGWLSGWLNCQQLGPRSRFDHGASLSCNLETSPSIDHITSTKVCSSLLPPNLPPSTYRNLAVHLRSSPSSSSSSTSASFLFSSLRLFLSIKNFLLQSPSSVILKSPQSITGWSWVIAVGFSTYSNFLHFRNI